MFGIVERFSTEVNEVRRRAGFGIDRKVASTDGAMA